MKTIILAAGMGTRLGFKNPKGLIKLPNNESILRRQIRILRAQDLDDITLVVGYKKELIMSEFPDVEFVLNLEFSITNTAKSLLCAVKNIKDHILWMNGDIVFDDEIIALLKSRECNTVVVNRAICGEEEVKYLTNKKRNITKISKEIKNGEGEALGINLITKELLPAFIRALEKCENNDYFEKAMQFLIDDNIIFKPLNVSNHRCIEIDNKQDLEKAFRLFS